MSNSAYTIGPASSENDAIALNTEIILEATRCRPSTLSTWRIRNGLFPHHPTDGRRTEYDVGDAVALQLMRELTRWGFETQCSVTLVNELRPQILSAIKGLHLRILIARRENSDDLEFKAITFAGGIDTLGWFADPIVLILHLGEIAMKVGYTLMRLRAS